MQIYDLPHYHRT